MQRYYKTVLDAFGNPAPGVAVFVIDANTGNPASLYLASQDLSTPTQPIANPQFTNFAGYVGFAVPDGQYKIIFSGGGIASYTENWITIQTSGITPPVMTGATSTTDGAIGAVPAPLAGEEAYFLRGDATWAAVVIPVVADMVGASSGTDGAHGLVVKPVAGDQVKFLRGDATFASVPAATGIRSTVTYTTASLASGASEDGPITVPKAYSILRAAVDYPSRVRLYLTSAQRTADAARLVTVDPTGNHGCMLECVFIAGVLDLDLSPCPTVADPTDGTTVYLALANDDTVSRAITLTLDLLSMEA